MLPLHLLAKPLQKLAETAPTTTAPKPMLGGMFGKAGKLLSSGIPALPDTPSPSAPPRLVTAGFDPLANRMPATRTPEIMPRVEDVAIPSLPGRTGGSRPYDPQTKHEFEYVMSKVPRDTAGAERKPTFGERFKSSLLPALLGTVQGINARPDNPLGGAIGGATAGFAGGMIDPISARQYEWNQMYKPELDAQEAHTRQVVEDVQRKDEGLVNLEARRAGIDYTKTQTEAMRANNQANQAYKASQVTLNEARAEALRTGKPQVRDIVDENGQTRTFNVYADGSMVELGGSAKAAMNTENNQTRRVIADNTNTTRRDIAGMNAKEAMNRLQFKEGQRSSSANPSKPGAKPGIKPVASSKRQSFVDRAVAAGYSRQEAEAEAKRRGL